MTAIAQETFPTVDELEQVVRRVYLAFEGAEEVRWRVQRIVEAFGEDRVLDVPTLETVGLLAEYLDELHMSRSQLGREQRTTRALLREVMTMRAEVAHREKLKGGHGA